MAKTLKAFVIILLLLSIASLTLGVMLFQQREILKGRILNLEKGVKDFAESLRYEELDEIAIKKYPSMKTPLDKLAAFGEVTWQDLQDTRQDLADTQNELDQTKEDLAVTRRDLADARDQIASLEDTLTEKEAELARAGDQIVGLEAEKLELTSKVDDLEQKLVESEETITDQKLEIETLEKLVKELTPGVPTLDIEGLAGNVLVVNPAWNFVVLDIGREDGLVPNAEMMVHRNDQLVGKVRISNLQDSMSVADIVRDWEKEPISEGDQVLYVLF